MSYHKFDEDEIIFNTIKTHPESNFYMFQTSGDIRLIYNNQKNPLVDDDVAATYAGQQTPVPNSSHVPYGFIELYGQNIARPYSSFESGPDLIYPFVTKDSGLASMSSVSTSQFNQDFAYGDIIKGLGVRGATISAQDVSKGSSSLDVNVRLRDALRTTFKHYVAMSRRFSYETGLEGLDDASSSWQDESFKLLQIPSIFYGEKIKKGTLKLEWYNLGKLVGKVEDIRQNGELIVTHSESDTEIGKFVGLVFYSEGFILLTGKSDIYSSNISPDQHSGNSGTGEITWKDFMNGLDNYKKTSSRASTCVQGSGGSPDLDDGGTASWELTGTSIVESSFVVQIPMGTNATPGAHVVVSSFSPEIEDIRLTIDEAAVEKYRLNRIGILQNGSVFELEAYSNGAYAVASAEAIANFISLYPINAMVLQDKNSDYSFNLYFKGQSTTPTMTMMANIEKTEGSHSNNSTFLDSDYEFVEVDIALDADGNLIPFMQENNDLVIQLKEEHDLTPIVGEFYPLQIDTVTDSNGLALFDGKILMAETMTDRKKLRIYRILEDGSKVKFTTNSTINYLNQNIVGVQPLINTNVRIQKNCYQKNRPFAGTFGYIESSNFKIKNTVKSNYNDPYAEFEDHTYISKIAIYDEDRNLIGIAKLATPVKKTPTRDFTFKLKIDL